MADEIGLEFDAKDFLSDMNWLKKLFFRGKPQEKALSAGAFIIEGKAKIDCPVDTGWLRSTIQAQKPEVDKKGGSVEVIVSAEYAAYVEYGTKFMGAQPYLRPATYENVEAIKNAMESILDTEVKRALE